MATIRVMVRLKQGVLDPQGHTVAHALRALAFDEVEDVRIGKIIELKLGEEAGSPSVKERVKAMCDKLLVNPVIEDYEILEA